MNANPPIKLSRLREIGWKEWDPIGLLASGEIWDRQPFADEYDKYMLEVAADLRRGGSFEKAVAYLLTIEREYIGLGSHPGQQARAEATVRRVQCYLTELDSQDPISA